MASPRAAVILAAGQGTRMKSALPKPLHKVGGKAMLDWSIDLARAAGVERVIVIHGPQGAEVAAAAQARGCETALQDKALGTAHAVGCAKQKLAGYSGELIVLYADTPLIQTDTIINVFKALEGGAGVAVLGFEAAEPGGYGRLIVNENNELQRIVEAADASADEKAVRLVNSGVLAADSALLFRLIGAVKNDNAKGEYYLTDVVALARAEGEKAVVVQGDEAEMLGVNDRADLARAEAAFQARKREEILRNGATMTAPETVFFSHDTKVSSGVTFEPFTVMLEGVFIGANAHIRSFSHLEGATIEAGAVIGPYARLRPGAEIGPGARVGNFVEVKKARLGEGAKANHLSYIGDAEVGPGANIGAGTITCNYDGFDKHVTVIGAGAFIGSNTALVAPVTVGAGAMTGSGATITHDVPDDALAVARAPQVNKDGWAKKFRALKAAKKTAKNNKTKE
ncbi:MAG: bifunctional UDP-N-acetylglucosamine diphosphorylase/glucosamine-1-phosphate N-acetyltransferase GlmU [Maricaulaceae bacterium]|nr:bifunctional UDP-N-acetylglucosamine diphosphorylase/glucosamine-1-phosphate N-acetyltransferase GlmU [Maricaulaceae bacterium]